MRYFNGLGRPFSNEGWDDPRHWLRRAWTLQEIKTENSTINAGTPQGSRSSGMTTRIIMNTQGTVEGQVITMRRAIRPILELAAEVDSPSGCSIYGLAREMAHRSATNAMYSATDKVAGLFHLLRPTQLPIYDENASPMMRTQARETCGRGAFMFSARSKFCLIFLSGGAGKSSAVVPNMEEAASVA